MSQVILITKQNLEFIIDEEDFAVAAKHPWHITTFPGGQTYVVRGMCRDDAGSDRPYRHRSLRLHAEIYRSRGIIVPPGFVIDHTDRNGLNNSFSMNLRVVSCALNVHNSIRRPTATNLTRGVRLTPNGRFQAIATVNGRQKHLGTFDTPEEAAETYRQHNLRRFGEAHG